MFKKMEIMKNMGLNWTVFRLNYELTKKIGLLEKKFPQKSLDDIHFRDIIIGDLPVIQQLKLSQKRFFFSESPRSYFDKYESFDIGAAIKEADEIIEKKIRYFSKHIIEFERLNWHENPLNNKCAPPDMHWTKIADMGSEFGDIKWIWELSRFSFIYPLARAYAATGDYKYAETFWNYFEDFIKNNPPELGPNYKCGQEMSLRVNAWIFGMFTFINCTNSTDTRLESMLKAIYQHIDHVDKHFNFALKSVKNNHTISEAAGLYTVGLLFPFFDKSEKWRRKGEKYIQSEIMWQIYDDGTYIQHSMNYQRVIIQTLTWVVRLSQINNKPFDQAFIRRFRKTVEFMYQNQDIPTGNLPNYGMNDGSYIHPITSCDYLDYRPSLQAAWYILNNELLYDDESVNEILFWLTGFQKLESNMAEIVQKSQSFEEGGYYVLRTAESYGLIRCATYKHRPGQADMLHFDFWYKGKNILADAGTFSYNTNIENILFFNGTSSHNTIIVNNTDQMKKGPRSIWLNWTKSSTIDFDHSNTYHYFEGEHYGYKDTIHRRAVLMNKTHTIIIDDVFGSKSKKTLSWLFGIQSVKEQYQGTWSIEERDINLEIKTYCSSSYSSKLFKGKNEPLAGWRSLYYTHKESYPQLWLETSENSSVRFVTIIGNPEITKNVLFESEKILVEGIEIKLNQIGEKKIVLEY